MGAIFQDDTREEMMRDLFKLSSVDGRTSADATMSINNQLIEFELKTTSDPSRSVTTVRDFGPEHIAKWKNKHWLIGFYDKGKENPSYFLYGSPKMMESWIDEKGKYIKPDFLSAKLASDKISISDMYKVLGKKKFYNYEDAYAIQKRQLKKSEYLKMMDIENGYSVNKMLQIFKQRIEYLIKRGSTLNNPHIPGSYFKDWETKITQNHANRLKKLVKKELKSSNFS